MPVPWQTVKCPPRINQVKSNPAARGASADLPSKAQAGSLTDIERPGDKTKQVLSKLEDLPLAPFPAAHLWSWESGGRGGGGGGGGEWEPRVSQVCGRKKIGRRKTDWESRGGPPNIRGRAELSAKLRSRLGVHLCQEESEEHWEGGLSLSLKCSLSLFSCVCTSVLLGCTAVCPTQRWSALLCLGH